MFYFRRNSLRKTTMKKVFTLVFAGIIFASSVASADVFTVSNVNDTGPGSLRQAILDANARPGTDTINFNIAGSGVQTIAPINALPDITNAVVINGFSQPGSSANTSAAADNSVHLIRLDGYQCQGSSVAALNFAPASAFAPSPASGSTVRGLVIVRFPYGIKINEASSVTVAGNWIGMDVDGIARGTSSHGIDIYSFFNDGFNNVIGGTTPADRNIISGNNNGIWIQGRSDHSLVQGNFIGTDPAGSLPRGNQFAGIYLFTSSNIVIGGPNAAARNIICATTSAGGSGVTIQGGTNNTIQGNYIGSDVSGLFDLGNLYDGIFLSSVNGVRITGNLIVNSRANGINISSSSGTVVENNSIGTDALATRPLGNTLAGVTISGGTNRVGGLSVGQPNAIFFNGGAGVEVTSATAVQNEISGNSIYDNGGLGIDLDPVGISTNDVLDTDSGANGLQNFPVLTNASIAFSAFTVQGILNSKAGATYRLEFFATPVWDATSIPEGEIFLGATNVTTDGSGNASFAAVLATVPATNLLVTATATDANGNTSEFSAGIGVVSNGVASPSLGVTKGIGGGGGGSGTTTTTVTWPSAATFFALEQAGSLQPPVQWQTVTSGITDSGVTKSFTITNAGGNTNQFFRLKKL